MPCETSSRTNPESWGSVTPCITTATTTGKELAGARIGDPSKAKAVVLHDAGEVFSSTSVAATGWFARAPRNAERTIVPPTGLQLVKLHVVSSVSASVRT